MISNKNDKQFSKYFRKTEREILTQVIRIKQTIEKVVDNKSRCISSLTKIIFTLLCEQDLMILTAFSTKISTFLVPIRGAFGGGGGGGSTVS